MPKLTGQTPDLALENIERLKAIFPDVFEEGKIDFEKLQQVLGDYVDDDKEHYNFAWNGKGRALRLAQTPSTGTLRPCPEESRNWDTTQNLYIEGDNLEVLKLLQKSYNGKVKMIYIDPPYNTGGDFVYPDDFTDGIESYKRITGQVDSEGNRISTNAESNGRYHTDWLNMMYPRLRLARNLLSSHGIIMMSIDDHEIDNAKKLCNEIFGEDNFLACLVWEKKKKGSFLSNDITNVKEYILLYAKQKNMFPGLIGEINGETETYPCVNAVNKREIRTIPAGIQSKYKKTDYFLEKGSTISDTTMTLVLYSNLVIKDSMLAEDLVIEGNWRYSQAAMEAYAADGEIYITRDLYLRRIVNDERYKTLKDLLPREGIRNSTGDINVNNLFDSGWGSNEDADEEQRLLFGMQKVMDYPKPVQLIQKLIASYRENDFIVLDFFSGSATTAHATIKLNLADQGKRRYIMVQLPENLDMTLENAANDASKKSIQATIDFLESINKAHTISEIGKERIRRAGDKIKAEIEEQSAQMKIGEEPKQVPDIGFKVFKLDSSNLKKWNGEAAYQKNEAVQLTFSAEALRAYLLNSVDNYMPGRTETDVVYEIMIKLGLDLAYPVETRQIAGKNVYCVGGGTLMLCLDDDITVEVARGMAALYRELNPKSLRDAAPDNGAKKEVETWKVVFKDNGFKDDSAKTNVREILKAAGLKEDAFTTV